MRLQGQSETDDLQTSHSDWRETCHEETWKCKFVADDVMCPKCSDCLRYKVTDSSYKFLTILNDFYVSVLGSAEIPVRIRVTALEGRHGDDQSHSRDPRRNNFSDWKCSSCDRTPFCRYSPSLNHAGRRLKYANESNNTSTLAHCWGLECIKSEWICI